MMPNNLKTEHIFSAKKAWFCVRKQSLVALLWAVFGFSPVFLHGQVVVSPAPALNLCVGGGFVTVGNIVIAETNMNDISDNGAGFTYIISLPSADYEFADNVGSVTVTGGDRLASMAIDVDPGLVTITFDHSSGGIPDEFTISNLQVRAVSSGPAGELRRTGGTSIQAGNQPSDNQNHLSISTYVSTLVADAGSPVTICEVADVNIGGSPAASGGTGPYNYSWVPATDLDDASIANPEADPTTTTAYTLTVEDMAGCSKSDNITVTVNPLPDASASDATICSGETSNVVISNPNSVSGTTYSWVVQSSTNVNGATGGSGSLIAQTLTSSDAINSGSVTYRITPTANGCSGSTHDVTVTVNPTPVIINGAASLAETICSGASLNFTPTLLPGSGLTTFSWTSSISGSISGASVSGSGSGAITDSPQNTGNTAGTVTYTITPTTGSCSGTPVDYVVTVNPLPDASASNATICSGETSNVVISNPNSVSGTTYSWVVQSSTNVAGESGGSGSLIAQTLTSSDAINSGSVTYRITPTANGCSGSTHDVTVTVNPTPVITNGAASLAETICSGASLNFTPTLLPGSGLTAFSWTSVISGSISGASVSGSGSGAITDAPQNTGNTAGTVTYTITPTTGSCSGTPVDYVVTVDPLPDASASNATICSGETSNVVISNPNGVSGTTYSWVIQSSTNVNGATGGSGSLIAQSLTSSDAINSGSVTYRITPTANGCSGSTHDVTVTVNPTPVITNGAASLAETICSGASLNFTPTLLPGSGLTTFSWTSVISGSISGASVSASGSGAITDAPQNTGNTAGTVTYTITPTTGSCSGTPVDYVVTVNPLIM